MYIKTCRRLCAYHMRYLIPALSYIFWQNIDFEMLTKWYCAVILQVLLIYILTFDITFTGWGKLPIKNSLLRESIFYKKIQLWEQMCLEEIQCTNHVNITVVHNVPASDFKKTTIDGIIGVICAVSRKVRGTKCHRYGIFICVKYWKVKLAGNHLVL